jgi:hypothetical protein
VSRGARLALGAPDGGGLGLPARALARTRVAVAPGSTAAQTLLGGVYIVTARGSFAHSNQDHRFGDVRERDSRDTAFGEIAVRHAIGRHTWVAGAAVERDAFHPQDLPRFSYTHTVPGVFVQDDVDLWSWLSLSASGRLDAHSEFGTFFSPRVSGLFRKAAFPPARDSSRRLRSQKRQWPRA